MSQRNPMNDRYQTDQKKKSTTHKSAAAAKPKTKAAASVYVTDNSAAKKAKQKQDRQKQKARQNEISKAYYNVPTEEYKKWRRIWWVCLIAAIVMVASTAFLGAYMPQGVFWVVVGASYVLIIAAIYIDFGKMRKLRKKWQAAIAQSKPKEVRAAQKAKDSSARESKKQAEIQAALGAEQPKKKKSGLAKFGNKLIGNKEANEEGESKAE